MDNEVGGTARVDEIGCLKWVYNPKQGLLLPLFQELLYAVVLSFAKVKEDKY